MLCHETNNLQKTITLLISWGSRSKQLLPCNDLNYKNIGNLVKNDPWTCIYPVHTLQTFSDMQG